MINFLAPYKLALFGLLAALVIGYVVILNLQVAHYKNKADELRIEVKNWQFTYNTLKEAASKQEIVIKDMAKIGDEMRVLGKQLLKDASLANGIRTPKINAASARLNALIKSDCVTTVASAKKELAQ